MSTKVRNRAAGMLQVRPDCVRVDSREGRVRVGVQADDSPAAEALGIEYTFDPRYPIGEGDDALGALLDLSRRVERERQERMR